MRTVHYDFINCNIVARVLSNSTWRFGLILTFAHLIKLTVNELECNRLQINFTRIVNAITIDETSLTQIEIDNTIDNKFEFFYNLSSDKSNKFSIGARNIIQTKQIQRDPRQLKILLGPKKFVCYSIDFLNQL